MKKELFVFLHIPKTGGTTFSGNAFNFFQEGFCSMDGGIQNRRTIKKKLREGPKFITGHTNFYGVHKLTPIKKAKYVLFLRDPTDRLVSLYNMRMSELNKAERISFKKWHELRKKNEVTQMVCRMSQSPKNKDKLKHKLVAFLRDANRKLPLSRKRERLILGFFRRRNKPITEKLDCAKRLLDKCWFVGITSKLDAHLPIIFSLMGIRDPHLKKYLVTGQKKSAHETFNPQKNIPKKLIRVTPKIRKLVEKENPLDVELYEYAKKLNKEKIKQIKQELKAKS